MQFCFNTCYEQLTENNVEDNLHYAFHLLMQVKIIGMSPFYCYLRFLCGVINIGVNKLYTVATKYREIMLKRFLQYVSSEREFLCRLHCHYKYILFIAFLYTLYVYLYYTYWIFFCASSIAALNPLRINQFVRLSRN